MRSANFLHVINIVKSAGPYIPIAFYDKKLLPHFLQAIYRNEHEKSLAIQNSFRYNYRK